MTHDGEQEIDAYVRRLLWALQALPQDDRLNIAGEIHSHLSECAARGPRELDRAMAGMGSPDALARSYVEEFELAGAVNRASPVTLLLTILDRGTRNISALICGFTALTLYLLAIGSAAVAIGKFIIPANVGVWTTDRWFGAGITFPAPTDAHEWLGYGIVPLAVAIGGICFVAAGKLLRWVGRRLLARTGARGRQGA